ncbi:LMF1 [Bugula neritina]|uniref:LMF1 n=1 Tax=Bugula neritina TaxID=10212 RepID=A0A7J7KAU3_BUGNE|nr:LMF1 [Bugula neritina]
MNTSFDPLKIVNTYGAFGSITRERTEVIVQGTYNNPDDPSARWYEYEFKCKPGNVTKRPCLISPYHYRLDWLMWFAAFQNYQHNPWLIHFVAKLLANDQLAVELIDVNPFAGKSPPKYIRLEHYRYEYSTFNSKEYGKTWWTRRKMGSYMPPVSLHSLQPYLQQMGWSS